MKSNLDLDPWDINLPLFFEIIIICVFGKQHDVGIDFYISHSDIFISYHILMESFVPLYFNELKWTRAFISASYNFSDFS